VDTGFRSNVDFGHRTCFVEHRRFAALFAFVVEDPLDRSPASAYSGTCASVGPCLQIAVKSEIGRKFGDVIDRHDDIHSLGFPDAHFNAVVCSLLREHVPEQWHLARGYPLRLRDLGDPLGLSGFALRQPTGRSRADARVA
jgi:hypothetical protein